MTASLVSSARSDAHRERSAPSSGTLMLAPEAGLVAVARELAVGRLLVAEVDPSDVRLGRTLRSTLDEAVENALAFRGALPPQVAMDAPLETVLQDQVMRARALGCSGLAAVLPTLLPLVDDEGRLSSDDGAAFISWLGATRRSPLVLVLGEQSRHVSLLAPVSVGALARQAAAVRGGPKPAADELPPSEPTPPPPRAALCADGTPAAPVVRPVEPAIPTVLVAPSEAYEAPKTTQRGLGSLGPLDERRERGERRERVGTRASSGWLEHQRIDVRGAEGSTPTVSAPTASAPLPTATPEPPSVRPAALDTALDTELEPRALEAPRRGEARPPRVREARGEGRDAREVREVRERAQTPPPPAVAPALAPHRERRERPQFNAELLRQMAQDLDGARGPKPPRVLEHLFTTRYVPLLEALSDGFENAFVEATVEAFRSTFDHGYSEAFAAMRVTGKRPSMVLDAPEVATRIARLNGARNVQLVLVDAMSYSVGERVLGRLKRAVGAQAVLVEQGVLWSALPTDTATQLTLLGRGVEGLREGAAPSEPDPGITRGRSVSTLRRERIGSRDLLKLDVVEARLRLAGPAFGERLDGIADEVTDVLARYVQQLQPRTLCYVFGDHGFRLPREGGGPMTGPAQHGGASPEEVLVPAFAILAGGVH